jgi:hypothetical protein
MTNFPEVRFPHNIAYGATGRAGVRDHGGGDLKHLAVVIHGTPELVDFAIDFHEHLVQVPAPVRV